MAGRHEALSSRDKQRVASELWLLHLSAARIANVKRDQLQDGPDVWIALK